MSESEYRYRGFRGEAIPVDPYGDPLNLPGLTEDFIIEEDEYFEGDDWEKFVSELPGQIEKFARDHREREVEMKGFDPEYGKRLFAFEVMQACLSGFAKIGAGGARVEVQGGELRESMYMEFGVTDA